MEIQALNRFVSEENLVWKRKDDWVIQKDEMPQNEIIENGDIIKEFKISKMRGGEWVYPMIVINVWQKMMIKIDKKFLEEKLKIFEPEFAVLCSFVPLPEAKNTKLSENLLQTKISVKYSSKYYHICFKFKSPESSYRTNLVLNIALNVNQFCLKLCDQIFVFSNQRQLLSKTNQINVKPEYASEYLNNLWWFKNDLIAYSPYKKKFKQVEISESEERKSTSVKNKKPKTISNVSSAPTSPSISNKIEEGLRRIEALQKERFIIEAKIEEEKKMIQLLEQQEHLKIKNLPLPVFSPFDNDIILSDKPLEENNDFFNFDEDLDFFDFFSEDFN